MVAVMAERVRSTALRLLAVVLPLCAAACAAPERADGVPQRGLEVARQWCGGCHAVEREGGLSPEPRAPAFASAVRRPGRNADYLARFVEGEHLPMPLFRLRPDEKVDVVAYLTSLQRQP